MRGGGESAPRGQLDIRHLNDDYDGMALALKAATLPKKAFKQACKEQKKWLARRTCETMDSKNKPVNPTSK